MTPTDLRREARRILRPNQVQILEELGYAVVDRHGIERLASRLRVSLTDLIEPKATAPIEYRPSVDEVQLAVARAAGVPVREIIGETRKREPAEARQLSYLVCRKHLRKSLAEIGRQHGKRDHSTVHHGLAAAEKRIASGDTATCTALHEIEHQLNDLARAHAEALIVV
ncbi:MAG: helix-turn-helix domain-containing protein [Pseudomonadota bacterium]